MLLAFCRRTCTIYWSTCEHFRHLFKHLVVQVCISARLSPGHGIVEVPTKVCAVQFLPVLRTILCIYEERRKENYFKILLSVVHYRFYHPYKTLSAVSNQFCHILFEKYEHLNWPTLKLKCRYMYMYRYLSFFCILNEATSVEQMFTYKRLPYHRLIELSIIYFVKHKTGDTYWVYK